MTIAKRVSATASVDVSARVATAPVLDTTVRVAESPVDVSDRRVGEQPAANNDPRVPDLPHNFLLLEGDAQIGGADVLLLESGDALELEGDVARVFGAGAMTHRVTL